MSNFVKTVPVPSQARTKPYHDSQEIVKDDNILNFFSANASKDNTRNNYITNPLPGGDARLVLGISFELIKQYIENDAANNIDVEKIINAMKDAGVTFKSDNDYKEFIREPLSHYFNFAGTGLNTRVAAASDGATAPALVSTVAKTATIKGAGMIKLPNPFLIAPGQSFELQVHFEDASNFPEAADWAASGQSRLFLRSTLYVAEGKPELFGL